MPQTSSEKRRLTPVDVVTRPRPQVTILTRIGNRLPFSKWSRIEVAFPSKDLEPRIFPVRRLSQRDRPRALCVRCRCLFPRLSTMAVLRGEPAASVISASSGSRPHFCLFPPYWQVFWRFPRMVLTRSASRASFDSLRPDFYTASHGIRNIINVSTVEESYSSGR